MGLTQYDAEELRTALLDAAQLYDAELIESNKHGQLYMIEFEMERGDMRATIHSGWIVRNGESFARLTSCYVV